MSVKTCKDCGEQKPLTEFYFDRKRDRPVSYCKACSKARSLQWNRSHREVYNANSRRWRRQNPDRQYALASAHRLGIAVGVVEAWLASQPNLCCICGHSSDSHRTRLHIDHDHETGALRGLLCHHCNTAVGLMRDNPRLLEKAAEYLRQNTAIASTVDSEACSA